MRFAVDSWDPDYGSSMATDPSESEAEVRLDVECLPSAWAAIPLVEPAASDVPPVVFIDGVRRIDARTWIQSDGAPSEPGIFASYGAGALRCVPGRAEIAAIEIGRVVASPAHALADVSVRSGTWRAVAARDATIESLTYAVHEAMTKAEVRVAELARRSGDEMIVVDGPLRDRSHVPDAVGLVKTHHVRYLEGHPASVVDGLAARERTPVFLVVSKWSRYSWYVRLPGIDGGPWSGVVRCEATAELAPEAVVKLAQHVSALLARFASEPHKEPRAPQNLYPIAGLERALRRRLGDSGVIYRALRTAAATSAGPKAAPASVAR
jgi:hypothetical protein